MESSSLDYSYAVVSTWLARFAAFRWLKREPRPSLNVETVLATACHRIDEQDAQLKLVTRERDLQASEIKLLEYELEWLQAVLREAKCSRCRKNPGIVLSDYDYLHVRGCPSKHVRRRRSKAAASCRNQRKGH